MASLVKKWNQIKKSLELARQHLSSNGQAVAAGGQGLQGTLEEYEEFVDHNELELAWDALVAVAERANADGRCWAHLVRAAELMELKEKQAMAMEKAKSISKA